MDKLYIGDIPKEFHYAVFNSNYIDLYKNSVLNNGTFEYYRIYNYNNTFLYSNGYSNYSQYNTTYPIDIEVTDDFRYRRDFPDIAQTIFLYVLLFIFLINIVTSSIKRGGVLGGLL